MKKMTLAMRLVTITGLTALVVACAPTYTNEEGRRSLTITGGEGFSYTQTFAPLERPNLNGVAPKEAVRRVMDFVTRRDARTLEISAQNCPSLTNKAFTQQDWLTVNAVNVAMRKALEERLQRNPAQAQREKLYPAMEMCPSPYLLAAGKFVLVLPKRDEKDGHPQMAFNPSGVPLDRAVRVVGYMLTHTPQYGATTLMASATCVGGPYAVTAPVPAAVKGAVVAPTTSPSPSAPTITAPASVGPSGLGYPLSLTPQ